jgi:hypothetical protein
MTQDGWQGILDKDEEIVWQGRPDGKIVFRIGNIATFVFGLFFAGFALFWMVMAAGAGGFFWMFGLLHFSVGVGIAGGALFWNAYKRRHSWYTLSNKRAFIALDLPIKGRALKSYPITGETTLEIVGDTPATIHFATEQKTGNNRTHTVKIGFERIMDGREVYAKIRKIQEGAA